MKNNSFNDSTDPVQRALSEWKVTASLPPRFEEQVWRRIASIENPPRVWQSLSAWIDQVFARPATAVAYMTVLIVLGLALGFSHAEKKASELQAQLSSRYVHAIDPYQRTP